MIGVRVFVLIAMVLGGAAYGVSQAKAKGVEPSKGQVILIHGLARTSWSMGYMGYRLRKAGYEVCTVDYASLKNAPDVLVTELRQQIKTCRAGRQGPVHFVTHSLGGLLLRGVFAQGDFGAWGTGEHGRVVMLAPPSKGSEIVDHIGPWPLFRAVLGPTGAALGTKQGDWPQGLPQPEGEVGVIAGSFSTNPLAAWLLPGADDGRVAVSATKLESMKDFRVLPISHSFLLLSSRTAIQVEAFLERGRFI